MLIEKGETIEEKVEVIQWFANIDIGEYRRTRLKKNIEDSKSLPTNLWFYLFTILSSTAATGLSNNRIKSRLRATYPC